MKKTIGIIGGMGPEGTADLYMKIVKYYQWNLGARYDRNFPAFFIASVPIPDVVNGLETERITLNMLGKAAIKLQNAGSDFILIACNTVQFLLKPLRTKVKIPIIGIASVTARYLIRAKIKKVGILATSVTINKKIYDQTLKEKGIRLIKPSATEQSSLTDAIMNQLAGQATQNDKKNILKIISRMKKRRAEAILVACTDLPMVVNQIDASIRLIDCTQVYADQAARLASDSKSVISSV